MPFPRFVFAALAFMVSACTALGPVTPGEEAARTADSTSSLLPYEAFTLDNGLTVIFHIDRSDPVVAVSLTAHVGSAREKPGRTGFAHLFEHLLFLESENLGPGGLDQLSARIGGSGANGSTNRDRTDYLQTVPNDALEKMLWAEADKLGWFINTVTEPVLEKEKQVVKNEKRQGVDNRPYGHTFYVMHQALYPEGHPYSWQVIGSLEDLQAATLDDVKEFYNAWYTPNNVTLVVAGDFDPDQARAWVERYFAEIPRGPEIERLEPMPADLQETVRLYHEDNFARLPQLTLNWPTVEMFHPDSYALAVLGELLTDGKEAPLNEVLIDEAKVAATVSVFPYTSELAGEWILQVSAFSGTPLDDVAAALEEGFARFESRPISDEDLQRVKIQQEVAFYNGLGSVLGKGAQLARYSMFAGDPGFIDEDLARIQAVTAEDVRRVYETYIKGRPHVATSFVPRGAPELALTGSVRAEVVIEPIVEGAEAEFDLTSSAEYERTPSLIDRSVEPPYGPAPQLTPPAVWQTATANGIEVFGITDDELPLIRFSLVMQGGHLLDTPETAGTANLLAEVLLKGTASRTPAELDKAFALLGANVSAAVTGETFQIIGSTLARNLGPTLALVEEALMEPRWDEAEFALALARTRDGIERSKSDPNTIAVRAFNLVNFGEGSMRARSVLGSNSSLSAITLEDLKAWHASNLSPHLASFRIVGDASQTDVMAALSGLSARWQRSEVVLPEEPPVTAPESARLHFYDVPGSSQSVLRFGGPSLLRTDPDFDLAGVMNYRLGGGGFASRLTQELREGKGYTYGIGSTFSATARTGTFIVSSGVRSNVTLEATELVREIMSDYAATFTEEDLDVTKSFFIKSQARRFESLGAKLNALSDIADYSLPYDYVSRQIEAVDALTVSDVQDLAGRLIRPDAMHYVIVGDAGTQVARLSALGLGEPVLINDAVDSLTR
ncbi:M16 family metallopeptidase [Hyphomonas sp.]|uniref:M16 family metallopeptidase n=1 Tax=Hyphomonas sp. TaxID=87 RepID=UPI00391CCDD1